MRKNKRRQRAEGQTTVTLSLAKELLEKINAAAKAENRSRSNWIVTKLGKLLDAKENT